MRANSLEAPIETLDRSSDGESKMMVQLRFEPFEIITLRIELIA